MTFYNGSAAGYKSGEWTIAAGPDRDLWIMITDSFQPPIFRVTIP